MELLSVSTDAEIVEMLAAQFFTIRQIAQYIGMDPDNLRSIINYDEGNDLAKAYWKGKMKTEILLRFDTLKFAAAGNPQASQEMKEYLSQQNVDENA